MMRVVCVGGEGRAKGQCDRATGERARGPTEALVSCHRPSFRLRKASHFSTRVARRGRRPQRTRSALDGTQSGARARAAAAARSDAAAQQCQHWLLNGARCRSHLLPSFLVSVHYSHTQNNTGAQVAAAQQPALRGQAPVWLRAGAEGRHAAGARPQGAREKREGCPGREARRGGLRGGLSLSLFR